MNKNTENWKVVYLRIVIALYSIAKPDEDSYNENAGRDLFKLIEKDSFLKQSRIFDFWKESKSIEPIQLFSLFNGNRLSDEQRTEYVEAIYRALKINKTFDEIDFEGCVVLPTIDLLSDRSETVKSEIWRFFVNAYERGMLALNDDFQKVFMDDKRNFNWYGINIEALTSFLYWISPTRFIPLNLDYLTYIRLRDKEVYQIKNSIEGYKNFTEIYNKK